MLWTNNNNVTKTVGENVTAFWKEVDNEMDEGTRPKDNQFSDIQPSHSVRLHNQRVNDRRDQLSGWDDGGWVIMSKSRNRWRADIKGILSFNFFRLGWRYHRLGSRLSVCDIMTESYLCDSFQFTHSRGNIECGERHHGWKIEALVVSLHFDNFW